MVRHADQALTCTKLKIMDPGPLFQLSKGTPPSWAMPFYPKAPPGNPKAATTCHGSSPTPTRTGVLSRGFIPRQALAGILTGRPPKRLQPKGKVICCSWPFGQQLVFCTQAAGWHIGTDGLTKVFSPLREEGSREDWGGGREVYQAPHHYGCGVHHIMAEAIFQLLSRHLAAACHADYQKILAQSQARGLF